jgi:hypothetical protein
MGSIGKQGRLLLSGLLRQLCLLLEIRSIGVGVVQGKVRTAMISRGTSVILISFKFTVQYPILSLKP